MATPLSPKLAPLARAAFVTELRMRARQALRSLFLGAIPTLTAIAGLVLHQKITHGWHGTGWRVLVGLVAVFAAVTLGAVVFAFVRRYPRHAGALRLDATFHNHDRVTSALFFAALPENERTPLMDAAIEDAIAHAATLKPSIAAPVLVVFLSLDVAIAGLLVAAIFGLSMLQWSRRVTIPHAPTITPVTMSADDLDLFRDTLKEIAQKDSSPENLAAIREMNQLIEDIAQKRLDRAEVWKRMDALQNGILKSHEAEQKALEDALKNAAEKLKESPLAKPAAEALAKKDFQAAEREMKKLAAQLRDKQSKLTDADKKRLKDALEKAAKAQKETLDKLRQKREELRASLLQREQKANPNDEEKRLLQRDKRELERLDRDIEDKEKAERELSRLDRELDQAAEDLMRELGLSADDLEKSAEDINRMGKQEMTEQEKEELRQRLEELRQLLRQEGQGGEELKKRLRKFALRARGQQGGSPGDERGRGERGQKGDQKGDQGEGQEGDEGEGDKEGRGTKGQGQGEGQGEGQGQGQGEKMIVFGKGNRSGAGTGEGQGQGQSGSEPRGTGEQAGGQSWGTGHDANVAGKKPTGGMRASENVQEAATDTGQGPSISETIDSAAQKGFKGRGYKKVYAEYKNKAEEAMKTEDIPPGYRFYVQRYFELIRPRE